MKSGLRRRMPEGYTISDFAYRRFGRSNVAAGVVADTMEFYMDEGGADGFMLIATYTPGCFEEFVDLVVPELQRRDATEQRTPTLPCGSTYSRISEDAFGL